DAARAGDLVPRVVELVEDVERERQGVRRIDPQPVPEAVDALVEDELVAVHGLARTEATRHRRELASRDARERALEDPVVVARPADRRAVREGQADVAV